MRGAVMKFFTEARESRREPPAELVDICAAPHPTAYDPAQRHSTGAVGRGQIRKSKAAPEAGDANGEHPDLDRDRAAGDRRLGDFGPGQPSSNGGDAATGSASDAGRTYSRDYLLCLRPKFRRASDYFGIRVEDIPAEEREKEAKSKQKPKNKNQTIGVVTECLPGVDKQVLQRQRQELKRIENLTTCTIQEKAGLRSYSVLIIGTKPVVEQALPLVEQALELAPPPEEPATGAETPAEVPAQFSPHARGRPLLPPPAAPPPPAPGLQLGDSGRNGAVYVGTGIPGPALLDEDWELPDHWNNQAGGPPAAGFVPPAGIPSEPTLNADGARTNIGQHPIDHGGFWQPYEAEDLTRPSALPHGYSAFGSTGSASPPAPGFGGLGPSISANSLEAQGALSGRASPAVPPPGLDAPELTGRSSPPVPVPGAPGLVSPCSADAFEEADARLPGRWRATKPDRLAPGLEVTASSSQPSLLPRHEELVRGGPPSMLPPAPPVPWLHGSVSQPFADAEAAERARWQSDAYRDEQREEMEFQRLQANMQRQQEELARKQAQAQQEAEELARKEAEDMARKEAEDMARKEAEDRARKDAEDRARREAEETARKEAEERARREADERARREAEDRARREAEKARKEADERARKEAQERVRKEAAERARQEAQETARKEAEDSARKKEEEKARKEAEQKARKEAEERARQQAEEKARMEAEERARKAQREADEKARREAEAEQRAKEAALANKAAEAERQAQAQLKAQRQAEEQARKLMEAEERAKEQIRAKEAAAAEKREKARLKAERDAEEKARRQAEKQREAEERARQQAEAAQRAAEEEARKLAEAQRAAEEEMRREAEERALEAARAKEAAELQKRARAQANKENKNSAKQAKAKGKKSADEDVFFDAEEDDDPVAAMLLAAHPKVAPKGPPPLVAPKGPPPPVPPKGPPQLLAQGPPEEVAPKGPPPLPAQASGKEAPPKISAPSSKTAQPPAKSKAKATLVPAPVAAPPPPPAPAVSSSDSGRPVSMVSVKSQFAALAAEDSDEEFVVLPSKKAKTPNNGVPAKAPPPKMGAAAAAVAAAKQKASSIVAKAHNPKAVNPLPQRSPNAASSGSRPMMMSGGIAYASTEDNSASGRKWNVDRPVERVVPASQMSYEEEVDPDMACYLWDRRAQRSKAAPTRGAPPAKGIQLGGPPIRPAPPPNAAKQRQMLIKVVEMGFDEPTARRALTSTNWSSVEDAVAQLFG